MQQEIMSDSRRKRVTGCVMAYYFSDILKLKRKIKSKALRLGTLWHQALALLFTMNTLSSTVDWVLSLDIIQDVDESPEESEKRTEIITMVAGMLRGYGMELNQFLARYEILEVEYPYLIRINNNSHKTGKYFPRFSLELMPYNSAWTDEEYQIEKKKFLDRGGINFVTGWIDLMVRDHETGKVLVGEHKTCMETGPDTFERKIKWSFQSIGYSVAGILYAMQCGMEFGGYIYNVARKAVIGKPVLRKCPKCKGEGERLEGRGNNRVLTPCSSCEGTGIGGINKTSTNVRIEDVEAIFAQYPYIDREEYSKFIQNVSANNYFWQHSGVVGYKKMQDWIMDSVRVCGEERRLKRLKRDQCLRHINNFVGGCLDCPYKEICFVESDEDMEYLINELYTRPAPAVEENEKENESKKGNEFLFEV